MDDERRWAPALRRVFSRTISFSDNSRPSGGRSEVGELTAGAVSLVGEVCELERYELEFLRMPVSLAMCCHIMEKEHTPRPLRVCRRRVHLWRVCRHFVDVCLWCCVVEWAF